MSSTIKIMRSFTNFTQCHMQINRLNQVQGHLNTINSLCTVLGMDFIQTICRIHPTLDDSNGAKDVSNNTIARLAAQIQSLQELKIKRMQKVSTSII